MAGAVEIEFAQDPAQLLNSALRQEALAIRGASKEAVSKTTTEVKLAIRAFINAHFRGSDFTSNGNRRVANASAQEKTYDEIESKGQFTGLIYSKFGKRDATGFVDFLLLHIRGGTVKGNNWLRLQNTEVGGTAKIAAQSGFFESSNSDIFFLPSKDGKKLFQLRRFRNERDPKTKKLGRTVLLATLVRQIAYSARLLGLDAIAARRPELFDRHFAAALAARRSQGGSA